MSNVTDMDRMFQTLADTRLLLRRKTADLEVALRALQEAENCYGQAMKAKLKADDEFNTACRNFRNEGL